MKGSKMTHGIVVIVFWVISLVAVAVIFVRLGKNNADEVLADNSRDYKRQNGRLLEELDQCTKMYSAALKHREEIREKLHSAEAKLDELSNQYNKLAKAHQEQAATVLRLYRENDELANKLAAVQAENLTAAEQRLIETVDEPAV